MRIAVLVSGGVDSSVVVDLLYKQGHELHLYYIRIGGEEGMDGCTAEEDIEMCSFIAAKYGLPLEVVTLHDEYWEDVMGYTLRTVKEGKTPHPDMMCNKLIKFGYFERRWGKDYDKTATGHYASIKERDGKLYLATAVDPVKDQTDFLAQISYDQLSHIMFPLGDLPKSEVRRLAQEANLPTAVRKDSQGICFLGKIDYSDFIKKHLGVKRGPVIDISNGKKIGEHNGYWFYTIGQRKGLGLGGGPWFVVKKNVRDNVIYVSNGYDTKLQYGREISLAEMHWITENPLQGEAMNEDGSKRMAVSFKTRHTPEFHDGEIIRNGDDEYKLVSESDVQGIAPGQYAIIYDRAREICYGSGVINN